MSELTGVEHNLLFINGEVLVYTAEGIAVEQAIGVTGDKISFIGSTECALALASRDCKIVDLYGRTVMPGLHDAHMHGRRRGLDGVVRSSCDMDYEGGTIEQILAKLKRALLAESSKYPVTSEYLFIATNLFGPAVLPRGTSLTRADLDRLSLDRQEDEYGIGNRRPIIVIDKGVHSKFANSIAIENAGVDTLPDQGDGRIGRDESGKPNGVFNDFDGDWGPLAPAEPDEDYRERLADLSEANRCGITSMFEAGGTLHSAAAWSRAAVEGVLTARVNQSINVTGWARGAEDPGAIDARVLEINEIRAQAATLGTTPSAGTLTVDTVKIFADGEAEYPHQTAAMLRPYNENRGTAERPEWQPSNRRGEEPSASDARAAFLALDRAGWNIHVHCLGDRSTRETLDNFADVRLANAHWDRRHTICHLTFVDPADIPRFSELGVICNMSLQWAKRDAWSVDAYDGYIDAALLDRAYPARELLDAGAVLSGGSDWPVDPLDPWMQIQTAVTRELPANAAKGIYGGKFAHTEAITVDEALIMHTLGGAIQMHQEDVTGSLEVGKFADLIVLEQNPRKVPPAELSLIRVLSTYVGGSLVSGVAQP